MPRHRLGGSGRGRPTSEGAACMQILASDQPKRVALYCRVSSEDQAERGTIGAQRTLLQDLANTFKWDVAQLYEDDGVSGTVLLADRPQGRRLLEDARVGRFSEVVFFRIDRLARSL